MWRRLRRGMFRGQRVSEGVCYCGRKVANLKIYLFCATKQDRVGPSLQSRKTFFLQLNHAVHTVQWNWICKLGRYLMRPTPHCASSALFQNLSICQTPTFIGLGYIQSVSFLALMMKAYQRFKDSDGRPSLDELTT